MDLLKIAIKLQNRPNPTKYDIEYKSAAINRLKEEDAIKVFGKVDQDDIEILVTLANTPIDKFKKFVKEITNLGSDFIRNGKPVPYADFMKDEDNLKIITDAVENLRHQNGFEKYSPYGNAGESITEHTYDLIARTYNHIDKIESFFDETHAEDDTSKVTSESLLNLLDKNANSYPTLSSKLWFLNEIYRGLTANPRAVMDALKSKKKLFTEEHARIQEEDAWNRFTSLLGTVGGHEALRSVIWMPWKFGRIIEVLNETVRKLLAPEEERGEEASSSVSINTSDKRKVLQAIIPKFTGMNNADYYVSLEEVISDPQQTGPRPTYDLNQILKYALSTNDNKYNKVRRILKEIGVTKVNEITPQAISDFKEQGGEVVLPTIRTKSVLDLLPFKSITPSQIDELSPEDLKSKLFPELIHGVIPDWLRNMPKSFVDHSKNNLRDEFIKVLAHYLNDVMNKREPVYSELKKFYMGDVRTVPQTQGPVKPEPLTEAEKDKALEESVTANPRKIAERKYNESFRNVDMMSESKQKDWLRSLISLENLEYNLNLQVPESLEESIYKGVGPLGQLFSKLKNRTIKGKKFSAVLNGELTSSDPTSQYYLNREHLQSSVQKGKYTSPELTEYLRKNPIIKHILDLMWEVKSGIDSGKITSDMMNREPQFRDFFKYVSNHKVNLDTTIRYTRTHPVSSIPFGIIKPNYQSLAKSIGVEVHKDEEGGSKKKVFVKRNHPNPRFNTNDELSGAGGLEKNLAKTLANIMRDDSNPESRVRTLLKKMGVNSADQITPEIVLEFISNHGLTYFKSPSELSSSGVAQSFPGEVSVVDSSIRKLVDDYISNYKDLSSKAFWADLVKDVNNIDQTKLIGVLDSIYPALDLKPIDLTTVRPVEKVYVKYYEKFKDYISESLRNPKFKSTEEYKALKTYFKKDVTDDISFNDFKVFIHNPISELILKDLGIDDADQAPLNRSSAALKNLQDIISVGKTVYPLIESVVNPEDFKDQSAFRLELAGLRKLPASILGAKLNKISLPSSYLIDNFELSDPQIESHSLNAKSTIQSGLHGAAKHHEWIPFANKLIHSLSDPIIIDDGIESRFKALYSMSQDPSVEYGPEELKEFKDIFDLFDKIGFHDINSRSSFLHAVSAVNDILRSESNFLKYFKYSTSDDIRGLLQDLISVSTAKHDWVKRLPELVSTGKVTGKSLVDADVVERDHLESVVPGSGDYVTFTAAMSDADTLEYTFKHFFDMGTTSVTDSVLKQVSTKHPKLFVLGSELYPYMQMLLTDKNLGQYYKYLSPTVTSILSSLGQNEILNVESLAKSVKIALDSVDSKATDSDLDKVIIPIEILALSESGGKYRLESRSINIPLFKDNVRLKNQVLFRLQKEAYLAASLPKLPVTRPVKM